MVVVAKGQKVRELSTHVLSIACGDGKHVCHNNSCTSDESVIVKIPIKDSHSLKRTASLERTVCNVISHSNTVEPLIMGPAISSTIEIVPFLMYSGTFE